MEGILSKKKKKSNTMESVRVGDRTIIFERLNVSKCKCQKLEPIAQVCLHPDRATH